MKAWLVCLVGLLLLTPAGWAEQGNGLIVTAQKTLLDREKNRGAFYEWDKVEKALGLKVAARNVSLTDFSEGSLEYIVIVRRWGRSPEVLESYTGTEKFPALAKSGNADLVVGKVPLSGYEAGGNHKQFQDNIEGWQIIVKHGEEETIKLTSTTAFDKLLARSNPAPKKEH